MKSRNATLPLFWQVVAGIAAIPMVVFLIFRLFGYSPTIGEILWNWESFPLNISNWARWWSDPLGIILVGILVRSLYDSKDETGDRIAPRALLLGVFVFTVTIIIGFIESLGPGLWHFYGTTRSCMVLGLGLCAVALSAFFQAMFGSLRWSLLTGVTFGALAGIPMSIFVGVAAGLLVALIVGFPGCMIGWVIPRRVPSEVLDQ